MVLLPMLVAVAMSFEVIQRDIVTTISLTGSGMCLRVPKRTIFSRESVVDNEKWLVDLRHHGNLSKPNKALCCSGKRAALLF